MKLNKFCALFPSSIKKRIFEEEENEDENWLTKCSIAVSRDSKLISFAHEKKLIYVKFDPLNPSEKQEIEEIKNICQDFEKITCSLILNLSANENNSRQKIKEKYFFFIGTSEGNVLIFNFKGQKLHEEIFSNAPVVKIKNSKDDLFVIYSRFFIKINGTSLIDFLIRKKNLDDLDDVSNFSYKKWYLNGQEKINDAIWSKETSTNVLEFYKSKSVDCIIGVGLQPSLAMYTSKEGQDSFISASKIASKVASKVSSAVFSFAKNLIWGGEEEEEIEKKKSEKIPNSNPISLNLKIDDTPREMKTILIDPTLKFVLTTDNLGRVIIYDLLTHTIMKIFKGYRNANVSWMLTEKKLFVVIYAPKKGIIEFWNLATLKREQQMKFWNNSVLIQLPDQIGEEFEQDEISPPGNSILITSDGSLIRISEYENILDTMSEDVNSDVHFYEKFLKGVDNKSIDDAKQYFQLIKSEKYIILALEKLDSQFSCKMQIEYTKSASSSDFVSPRVSYFTQYLQNRFKLLESYQYLEDDNFELNETLLMNEWSNYISKELVNQFDQFDMPNPTFPKRIDAFSFLQSFEITQEQIKVKNTKTASYFFKSMLFGQMDLFKTVSSIVKLSNNDLQELFCEAFLSIPVKLLLRIPPKLILDIMELIKDPKNRIFTKITKYCKETKNSSNSILLINLCKEEIQNFNSMSSRLNEIFLLQFYLKDSVKNGLSLNTFGKETEIYELFGIENLRKKTNLEILIQKFPSNNSHDLINFYSSSISFKNEKYEDALEYFNKLSKSVKSACCLIQLKELISSSKSLDLIFLESQINHKDENLKFKIVHLTKLFKQCSSEIKVINDDEHSKKIIKLQKEVLELDFIFNELYSLLSFIEIIYECQSYPKFNLYRLFSMESLNYLFPNVPKKTMKEKQNQKSLRKDYLVRLSQLELKQTLKLCDSFDISRDFVHIMYIKEKYQKYEDQDASVILLKVKDKIKVGKMMVEIARSRFGLIFQHLSTDKKNLPLLSHMPVQLFQWISNQMSDTNHDIEINHKFINNTKAILEQCIDCLTKDLIEYKKAIQMLQFINQISSS
eukprot:gene2306-2774_t